MDQNLLLSFNEVDRTHWWFVGRRRIILDAMRATMSDSPARVVEVGCGPRGLLPYLAEEFPDARVEGMEPSEAAAAAACELGLQVCEAVFEDLPITDASVDVLLALDVLEHCADDHAALSEAIRVLAPGGRFVVSVPALPSLWSAHDDLNHHYRRYTMKTLSALLSCPELKMRRLSYFNTLLLPLGAAVRLLERIAPPTEDPALRVPSTPVNAICGAVFQIEAAMLRHADMPIGMSLLAVAERR